MVAYRRVTACTPGLAPGPTLGIEYGKPLPFTFTLCRTSLIHYERNSKQTRFNIPSKCMRIITRSADFNSTNEIHLVVGKILLVRGVGKPEVCRLVLCHVNRLLIQLIDAGREIWQVSG